MFLRSRSITAALLVSLLAASQAHAQGDPDPNLPATYGTVKLKAGFLPDPYTKHLQAGGELRTNLGGVSAHVARAPDFSLHYTAGQYPLTCHVKSVGDTTLLINLPDGSWVADDDGGGNFDPLIRIAKPQSGRYDIYVGTYRKGLLAATLHITERNVARPEAAPPPVADKNLPACYIVSVGVDNYRNANKLNGCLNDARNTVAAFRSQVGSRFSKVEANVLLDGQATRANLLKHWRGLTAHGATRDHMVLFLSGHGGRTNGNRTWFFLPCDFHPNDANTNLTDQLILETADTLVQQNKHVSIIIDACFCGQLRQTAEPYLRRYQNAGGGSLTLMLSSAADQTSAALGNYSAFAKAFSDGMTGAADLNRDGKITLGEVQTYSSRRTHELLQHSRIKSPQDCLVAWSPSLSRDTIYAATRKDVAAEPARPAPSGTATRWAGTETLAGYGKLSFALYPDGRAVMTDAKETTEGIWRKVDNRYTLSFNDGAVVYIGILNGDTLSGMAMSPGPRRQAMQSWSWSATRQTANGTPTPEGPR